jgi:predicted PurR-regulated permease PerM
VATGGSEVDRGPARAGRRSAADPLWIGARATVGVVAVVALTLGLWRVRGIVILLLLALNFAAAMRPGVAALRRRRVPEAIAIVVFFTLAVGALVLFFWLAVPPALHEVEQALSQPATATSGHGVRHDVLAWLQQQLQNVPSGAAVLHPVATYGKKATDAVAGTFFTLAATWYLISERDRLIDVSSSLVSEGRRETVRRTLLAIDERVGAYIRRVCVMITAVGLVLSTGFYLVGLHYWLLVGGTVSLLEVIPVIGPTIGVLLVAVVGLSQSLHVMALALVVIIGVRQIQDYVVNPRVMGGSVGLSPLTTLVTVSVVGILFGPFAVVLAIPATSTVATLIDVLVLGHEPPAAPERRGVRRRSAPAAAPRPRA